MISRAAAKLGAVIALAAPAPAAASGYCRVETSAEVRVSPQQDARVVAHAAAGDFVSGELTRDEPSGWWFVSFWSRASQATGRRATPDAYGWIETKLVSVDCG